MDHVSTLLMLMVPFSVLCENVPAPVNLTITSHHMVHLLTWQDGPESTSGIYYRVIFRSYRLFPDWIPVASCQAVRFPLLCNLTDVLSDPHEDYYVNVTAVAGNKTSTPCTLNRPFKPISDTELEPPSLHLSPCRDLLCVYLHSPAERLDVVYKKFQYQLNVSNAKGVQFTKTTKGMDTVELKVVPGLEYCVSVNITDHRSTASKPECASTPVKVNRDMWYLVLPFLLALVLVIVLFGKRHMFSKSPPPDVLSSFNPPYKVQILPQPSIESLNRVFLEPRTYDNDEVDQEKEYEEVVYERRRHCGEIAEETNSSPPSSPDVQIPPLATGTLNPALRTFLEELPTTPDLITFHADEKDLQKPSGILKAHVIPPPGRDLYDLYRNIKEDELGVEEKEVDLEDTENVNFFSLTFGGHDLAQHDKSENDEDLENGSDAKPEVALCTLRPPEPASDLQPMYSENTDRHFSYSGDEDEEESFSGYMMRN